MIPSNEAQKIHKQDKSKGIIFLEMYKFSIFIKFFMIKTHFQMFLW